MSTPAFEEITSGLEFPEGPVWMPDGTVLVTELKGGRVQRVHADGRKEVVAEPGGSPNGLAIGPDGALYVCNSGGWDFLEIGDFTIPETTLPATHSGGRIERKWPEGMARYVVLMASHIEVDNVSRARRALSLPRAGRGLSAPGS